MRIFKIDQSETEGPDGEIVPALKFSEPATQEDGSPSIVYAGTSFIAFLVGEPGEDDEGLSEVDYSDEDVKSELAASIRSFVNDVSELDATLSGLLSLAMAPPLEVARSDAFEAVKAAHEDTLVQLSGGASVAERDTWPNQKDWAFALRDLGRWLVILDTIVKTLPDTSDDLSPIIEEIKAEIAEAAHSLSGLLTLEEIAQLEAAGVSPSDFMASKIVAKVRAMGLLITTATRIKRTGDAAIAKAATVAELGGVMTNLEAQSEAAMAAFVAQSSGA
ncbi:hypothetical protein [uncultured Planktomarina sp.]|uniref:hypothetical protein n=1 Tax=uncultured Planktomarina sp. TaxID=1538529 RepID=UPI003260ED1B